MIITLNLNYIQNKIFWFRLWLRLCFKFEGRDNFFFLFKHGVKAWAKAPAMATQSLRWWLKSSTLDWTYHIFFYAFIHTFGSNKTKARSQKVTPTSSFNRKKKKRVGDCHFINGRRYRTSVIDLLVKGCLTIDYTRIWVFRRASSKFLFEQFSLEITCKWEV